MPVQSKPSQARRHGLGDGPFKLAKHEDHTDLQLSSNHPCAPTLPRVFNPSPGRRWPDFWTGRTPTPLEHHDSFPAWEQQPQPASPFKLRRNDSTASTPAPTPTLTSTTYHHHQHHTFHERAARPTSHAELARLSSRPYSLRASDPSDFASAWEGAIVPLLTDLLQKHCACDFLVDVHNFPELSSSAVPRVIYVTLSPSKNNSNTANDDDDGDGDADDSAVDDEVSNLEQTLRTELARAVPAAFSPVYLEFRRGSVRKSMAPSRAAGQGDEWAADRGQWWGRSETGGRDDVCEPKNVNFRPTPVMGMSIGPVRVRDAASLGGFVLVGGQLYAMSAFHAFESSFKACNLDVSHPAQPDLPLIVPSDPRAQPYKIGSLSKWASPGTLRPSLSFQGRDFHRNLTMVEMDWALIGPVDDGKNFVPTPSFRMDRHVAVQDTAQVEGNTEVYAMARTSGYSLGFTSDVPGLQRISGKLRREWTVRQYSPLKSQRDSRTNPPWQSLKQWVTSGIGVSGDSGAWLIRRSDNAVMGLIWGRNHDSGNPLERVRLTYFTPMVDVLADAQEKLGNGEGSRVTLPVYSAEDLGRHVDVRGAQEVVQADMAQDPWTVQARGPIRQHQQVQADLIQSQFADGTVPAFGLPLGQRPDLDDLMQPSNRSTRSPNHGPVESSAHRPNDRVTATPVYSNSADDGITTSPPDTSLLGLELGPTPDQTLPALSLGTSSSPGTSLVDETSDVGSMGDGVRIVGPDEGIDVVEEIEEPVRAKASFDEPKRPGLLMLAQPPPGLGTWAIEL